jgi:hypothetical protein
MATPTARTLDRLKQLGYTAEVVERWLPIPGRQVRRDFLGCIDIIAVGRRDPRILAVQATSLTNVAARVAKARKESRLTAWLQSGAAFQVWGWHQQADGCWEPKIVDVKAGDVEPVVILPRRRRSRRPVQRGLFD